MGWEMQEVVLDKKFVMLHSLFIQVKLVSWNLAQN